MNTCKHESGFSTFRDWFDANVDDEQVDRIRKCGIDSGVATSLIHYSQTVPLYNEFANELWELVLDGHQSIHDIVKGRDISSASGFANYMVWYAADLLAWMRNI